MSRSSRRTRPLRAKRKPHADAPAAPVEPDADAATVAVADGQQHEHEHANGNGNGAGATTTPSEGDIPAIEDLPPITDTQGEIVEPEQLTAAARRVIYGRPRKRTPVGARRTWNSTRRTAITVLVAPLMTLFLIAELMRELAERFGKRGGGETPEAPEYVIFRRPAAMPKARSERSVADVVAHLRAMPFRPLGLPTHIAFYREYGAEGMGVLFSSEPALATIPHLYPRHFRPRLFEGSDGVQLAGIQALHTSPGPALILCHGLLTTKNFDYIRTLAKRAYSEWGFHVVAVDLRSWGQSAWTTDAPASGGYMEGRDVMEIARHLHENELVTSVGAIGFSLGGSTVLNAAHHSSNDAQCPLDGGVMSVSAPTDIGSVIDYITDRPHWKHPFFGLWIVYKAALRAGVRRMGLDRSFKDWKALLHGHSMPYYGLPADEFLARTSAQTFADKITVPTLALHAGDDFVVPVEHAYGLDDAAAGNENVEVWVVDSGNHCAFTAVDERWFFSVVRRWFEYWADEPERPKQA